MMMREIDKQFLEIPFYGVRQMTWHLRNDDHVVNEKRIRRRTVLLLSGLAALSASHRLKRNTKNQVVAVSATCVETRVDPS